MWRVLTSRPAVASVPLNETLKEAGRSHLEPLARSRNQLGINKMVGASRPLPPCGGGTGRGVQRQPESVRLVVAERSASDPSPQPSPARGEGVRGGTACVSNRRQE